MSEKEKSSLPQLMMGTSSLKMRSWKVSYFLAQLLILAERTELDEPVWMLNLMKRCGMNRF